MNYINNCGKVLFYGGYSVLVEGNISLSIAVIDKGGGTRVYYKEGKERIISKQFGIDVKPSLNHLRKKMLISYPYIITKLYLKKRKLWKGVEVKVRNSKLMGSKNNKSGMGSSAALSAGIVKALFKANGLDVYANISEIHKLAQYSYAYYSGKAGSGFDIATTTYERTIIYRRYPSNVIELPSNYKEEEIVKKMDKSIAKVWKGIEIKPVSIGVDLLLFNISGKRDTIKASLAFKEWKKRNKRRFKELMEKQNYYEERAIRNLLEKNFEKVRQYTDKAREVHRKMQKEIRKVVEEFEDIEGEEMKELMDEINDIQGVIASRLPGAGGRDSLAVMVEKKSKELSEKILKKAEKRGLKLRSMDVDVL